MAVPTRTRVLSLYRSLLRESGKFHSYNYRMYFLRRVKEEFREHKSECSAERIGELCELASMNLDVIRRQVLIGQLYQADPLVIERKVTERKLTGKKD